MKALWILSCFCLGAFSDPVGNPTLPFLLDEGFVIKDTKWSNPQVGFTGDYLIHKRLKKQQGQLRNGFLSGTSETASIAWSIRERFNLQLRLGSGQYNWGWQQENFNITGRSTGGLIWGGDAKLVLLNIKDTFIALDGQAGGWDWMMGPSEQNGRAASGDAVTEFRYWQVGGAITQKMAFLSPYIGFAVQRMRLKVSHLLTKTGRLNQRHQIGPFGGCSLCYGPKVLLNVEFRGWYEEGVSLMGQFRF